VIEGFGRVFAKGFGIAQGCNDNNTYTHNDVYDGYSGGINIGALNCPFQGDSSSLTANNLVSFNNVYNLGQGVTNDFGCIYFNTTPPGATPPTGNQALNNVCHDVNDGSVHPGTHGYGGQGIYIDDYTGNVNVENNLVYRVSFFAIAQTCGPQGTPQNSPNIIKNNILAFSRLAAKYQGCTPSSATNQLFEMTNNLIFYDSGSIQNGCFSCLGGDCASVLPATVTFRSNLYCYVPSGSCNLPNPAFFSSNDQAGIITGCTQTTNYATLSDWQTQAGEDTASVLQNPFSSGPSSSSGDFTLTASPGVGFVLFDPSQAGSSLTAPAVLATFPTLTFSVSKF
jgi:hypothetical protein